ncbi:MAG: tRNA pseudouridine(38-40) synthase TruA [Croceivirga sp.]
MRYFIEFSYHGKAYHGWQNQPNVISVQAVLEKALSTLLRDDIAVLGAGRTDAGVHAKQMFAHFDYTQELDTNKMLLRLNAFLPNDIMVKSLRSVVPEAHARFDATERTYEYWVVREKNPFLYDFAHLVFRPIQISRMNEAANIMMEYSDFECFSKSNTDVKTFVCDIRVAFWKKRGEILVFTISADRFLRNMVRAAVGTLLEIGLGKREVADIRTVIEGKDRSKAGVSVPAKGLYLTKVSYPEAIFK